MSDKNGMISIFNNTPVNISATVVRYDYENYPDIKPIPINSGDSKTWERFHKRDYFCFLSDSKVLYGFLCQGGKKYEYLGKGQMRLPEENKVYKLDYDIGDEKHKLKILAVLEDVEIVIWKEKETEKNAICTKQLKKNDNALLDLKEGYYYLKIKNDETVYGVIPGKSYYIAKGQVLVEVDTNIIKKPHKNSDIAIQLE